MNLHAQLLPWLAGVLLAAVTYLGCHWWYGRRLADLLSQIERLDRARQSADQTAQEARKHIEQLQKDLAAQYRARTEALSAKKRAETDTRAGLERTLREAEDASSAHNRPAHGFADTQPMI